MEKRKRRTASIGSQREVLSFLYEAKHVTEGGEG